MARRHNSRPSGLSVTVDRDFNKALRLFGKKVQEAGILKEVRDRMYYEPPSDKKQRRKKMARKRWLKKLEQMNAPTQA
jgi:small subunit ribosomal protein S21